MKQFLTSDNLANSFKQNNLIDEQTNKVLTRYFYFRNDSLVEWL